MKKIFLGIDPGATGAIAFLTVDSLLIFDFEDPEALRRLRTLNPGQCRAVIEKVASRPGQGVSSTFKFGVNVGIWIGRLETLRIPFDYVTPQKWRKVIFDSAPRGTDLKAMSRDRAMRLFPEAEDWLKRKKDHSRAEALLLSLYCKWMDEGKVKR